jgi:hypothetical protein
MRVRAGLITVIYSKALVLSNDGRSRSTGDIVNLMSVDATRLQECCAYGLMVISGPVQVSIAFLCSVVGNALITLFWLDHNCIRFTL